jgi:hypothetical protein
LRLMARKMDRAGINHLPHLWSMVDRLQPAIQRELPAMECP